MFVLINAWKNALIPWLIPSRSNGDLVVVNGGKGAGVVNGVSKLLPGTFPNILLLIPFPKLLLVLLPILSKIALMELKGFVAGPNADVVGGAAVVVVVVVVDVVELPGNGNIPFDCLTELLPSAKLDCNLVIKLPIAAKGPCGVSWGSGYGADNTAYDLKNKTQVKFLYVNQSFYHFPHKNKNVQAVMTVLRQL